ncbi:extracellular solute-binding protein [Gorillibacterium massiliense]|uniref:extracellular solute-binding protein n=1 Tax=Gorillibacterium massiliense TaxID=1280390 RepID=UPI0004BB787E|nr:extracellular solute-binding protein [Gorillibacterium massiliense]
MAKSTKRIAAGLAAAVIAVSLAACSNNNKNSSDNSSSPAGTNATNGSTTQGEKLKPVTLRFYFPGDKPQATDEVWQYVSELTKDTLNAKFEVNFVNWNDFKNKMKLLQSSGDNYDLNFDGNWLDFPNAMNRGGYLDITDLLPKYAPTLYKQYTDNNLLDPIKVDGRVYAAPWTIKKTSKPIVWYRGDLAKKGGYTKDKVETTEDLDAMLHALKKAQPDILPISFRPDNWFGDVSRVFQEKYGYEDLNFHGLVVKIDDPEHKVIPWEQTEAFKEYVTYMKKWNDDGIIPKNLLATKGTEGDFGAGTMGSAINQIDGGILENPNTFKPQVAAQGAVKTWSEFYPDAKWILESPLGNAVAINKSAANPERALMFLEQLTTNEKLYDAVMYGIVDKTYKQDGRKVSYMEGQGNGNPSNYLDWAGQWGFWRKEFQKEDDSRTANYFKQYDQFINRPNNINSTVNYFIPDQTNIKTESAKREQVLSERGLLLMTGINIKDVESGVADFIAKEKDAGTDKIVTDVQKQLDAYMASQK